MKTDSLKQFVSLHQSLTAEKAKLETRLAAINKALGGSAAKATSTGRPVGRPAKKKYFSPAARASIAAAQRARWAKIKAAKK
ncbi:MAG: hypothetical protein RL616_296 [Verrucomicrobiota bacterium]|jgi:hypothetical protein